MECIEFATNNFAKEQNEPELGNESSDRKFRPEFLSWKMETDLCLTHTHCHHSSVVVGSKIVVVGGWDHNGKWASSMEVIDVEHREIRTVPSKELLQYDEFLLALPIRTG